MANILEKIQCISCELQSDKILLKNAIELRKSTKNDFLNAKNEDNYTFFQEKDIRIHIFYS